MSFSKRYIAGITYSILVAVLLFNGVVSALDETFYSGNDVLFYNPDAGACSVGDQSAISSSNAAINVTLAQANIKVGGDQRNRYTKTQDIFSSWNPDFVALQEISAKTNLTYGNYRGFKKNHPDASQKTEDTGVQIAWDSTRWTKIDGDNVQIHPPTDPSSIANRDRYALWATFKNKEGAVVSVISTHWNTTAWKFPNRSKIQAQNLKTLVGQLSPKGPVLIGGDFNYQYHAADESYSPKTVLSQVGMKSVFKGNPGGEPVYVDWMFNSSQLQVGKKKVFPKEKSVADGGTGNLTDHPYLIASFKGASNGIGSNSSTSSGGGCVCQQPDTTTSNISGTGTNKDYKGRAILTDANLKAIKENQRFYEAGAAEAKIPWQMIAVMHLRETGLRRYNPDNGDGPYQILTTNYPPSNTISDEIFMKQTKEAALFLKGKTSNQDGLKSGDTGAVKDAFFGYNGRASAYAEQAKKLGFNEPYEGSPYVMNIADAIRDPEAAKPGTWGQIKRDHGGIEYPANADYGAFVVFGALAGIASGDSCQTSSSAPVASQVVALAEQELKLWESGQLKPGSGYHKYSQGRDENWCADFVSWLYNQAGYPLRDGNEGNVAAVDDVRKIGEAGGKFEWHSADSGYVPRPGDMHIQKGSGVSHVSLVVAVDGGKVTKIGGNQGGSGGFNTSKVTKDNWMPSTSGYVSPKG
ncbi:MAG TPA: endonuclease/exonuclease/phosphatase family protein [Candidatus Saccharimonadales bacterium]